MKNIHYTFLLIFFWFHVISNRANAQGYCKVSGDSVSDLKPLEIGDKIPNTLWDIPLQTVNHPSGKELITLNYYKDKKLIILDFWATWCGSCIGNMPKNTIIEDEFPSISIIPVTYESATKVRETVKNNHLLKSLNFSSVISDSTLSVIFPHRSVPHLVWINQQGIVLATTYPSDLNKENIEEFLSTGDLKLNKKSDILDYDLDEPMTIFKRPDFGSEQLVRSTLTKYIAGIPSTIGLAKDISSGKQWFKATNMGVKNLLIWSDPDLKSIPRKLWDIDDNIYDNLIDRKDGNSRDWQENNLFCYEFYGSQNIDTLRKSVKQDIERLFGITIRNVSKDTVQLVLESVNSDQKDTSKSGIDEISVARIIFLLNRRVDLPYAVTRIDRDKNYSLNEDIFNSASLDQINQVLKDHGIRLRKQIHKVNFLRFEKMKVE